MKPHGRKWRGGEIWFWIHGIGRYDYHSSYSLRGYRKRMKA